MNYFDWLVFTIAPDYHQRENYTELFFALYSTEFFWTVSRDKNRAEDGLDLRVQFERETGEYAEMCGPCNCLEMFVALAIRCEMELMYDPDAGDRTDEWFWMMMANLGLDEFESNRFDFYEVDDILWNFMNRNYGPNGEFCAFFDQKSCTSFDSEFENIELAYQLNYFIKEKFY